jgi:DNA-binding NtrC family response regulator
VERGAGHRRRGGAPGLIERRSAPYALVIHDTDFPFLAKPFTQQALHQAVEHAIERATLERPARVPETREATHDLVTYARGLRRP